MHWRDYTARNVSHLINYPHTPPNDLKLQRKKEKKNWYNEVEVEMGYVPNAVRERLLAFWSFARTRVCGWNTHHKSICLDYASKVI